MDVPLRCPDDADAVTKLVRQTTHAKQRDRLCAVQLAIAGTPTLQIMAMLERSRDFVQRWVYTELMSAHLRMIAEEAGDDVHVVLVLDGAGVGVDASA